VVARLSGSDESFREAHKARTDAVREGRRRPAIRRQRRKALLHGDECVLGPWPRTGEISGEHQDVSLGQVGNVYA